MSEHTAETYMKLAGLSRELFQKLGREPSLDELAAAMEMTPEQITEMLAVAKRVMERTGGEEGSGGGEQDWKETLRQIRRAFRELPDQESGWQTWGMQRSIGKEFEQFTPRARKALALAVDAAADLGHPYIGTEHLLLGLMREGTGIAAVVLQGLDLSLSGVRGLIASMTASVPRQPGKEPPREALTRRAKRAISLAAEEAKRMNQSFIGTEHLLVGLVREGDGIAAEILQSVGISLEEVRLRVMRALTSGRRPSEHGGPKSNVVTCRINDRDLSAIDALVEAGIRSTRSDAASWLIRAGIEAHQTLFDRVHATVSEIRQLRMEAQTLAQQVEMEEGAEGSGSEAVGE